MSTKTRYVLLGLLTEGPLSGYQLKKLIDVRFRFFWNESFGQIYPELKRLESEQFILSHAKDPVSSKRTYTLTALGYQSLQDWLKQPVETESYRLEFILKMFFAGHSDPQIKRQHIETFKKAHEAEINVLKSFDHELRSLNHPNHTDILSVIQFGLVTNQAYIQWCNETLLQLKESHDKTK